MLLGVLAALMVAGVNIPLANMLAGHTSSALKFGVLYFPLGLVSVVLGFVLLSLFLTFSAQVYWFVGLMTYASIGGDKVRGLRARRIAGSGDVA
ncbi:hypothetical protein [Rothia nasimurium]|uniref:hypothetical protein n=1 Tax=Rothia nasimurium TaxID=85336 RepID=UPI001F2AAFDE|nr:hypothetical protein [Rothia nasimurium]